MKKENLTEGIFDFAYSDRDNLNSAILDIAEGVLFDIKNKNPKSEKFFMKLIDSAEGEDAKKETIEISEKYLDLMSQLEATSNELVTVAGKFAERSTGSWWNSTNA